TQVLQILAPRRPPAAQHPQGSEPPRVLGSGAGAGGGGGQRDARAVHPQRGRPSRRAARAQDQGIDHAEGAGALSCRHAPRSPAAPEWASRLPVMTVFTPHQDDALKAVSAWLKGRPGSRGTPQVFRLFGYAGTGKTTLARHLAEDVDGEVMFGAFTGKAALVMRRKGWTDAPTTHTIIL